MENGKSVIALVGSYRRGGVVDSAVDEILAGAQQRGAHTTKIFLMDLSIAFCTNCRSCTQEAGATRGNCGQKDDMDRILAMIAQADAIVLGSAMNFGTVTAITKRFIERLLPFAYWPWGGAAPQRREKKGRKRAVIVTATAAPAFMARPFSHIVKLLRTAVALLGAKQTYVLFIGLAALHDKPRLSNRVRRKARRLGKKIAA